MDKDKLLELWKSEEAFPFRGWDFSHIKGRYEEQPVPWDYRNIVKSLMHPGTVMLDMGTGGGEFLISLAPQAGRTYALSAMIILNKSLYLSSKTYFYSVKKAIKKDPAKGPFSLDAFVFAARLRSAHPCIRRAYMVDSC